MSNSICEFAAPLATKMLIVETLPLDVAVPVSVLSPVDVMFANVAPLIAGILKLPVVFCVQFIMIVIVSPLSMENKGASQFEMLALTFEVPQRFLM